jgi:hypothetical protein
MTDGKIDPTEYGFPAGLSQPALRALIEAGYSSIEKVSAATEKELLALHGFGPKGIRLFREAGVSFAGGGGAVGPEKTELSADERAARVADGDVHEGEAVAAGEPAVEPEEAAVMPAAPAEGEEALAPRDPPLSAFAVDAIAAVATVETQSADEAMLIAAERGQPDLGVGAVGPMDAAALVQAWRDAGDDAGASWVVFEHGTRVIVPEGEGDLAGRAAALLGEHGYVQFGTPSANFNVITPAHGRGWIVASHRPEIATYVGREEAEPYTDEITVGLIGRSKRGRDAEGRRVVHVEET